MKKQFRLTEDERLALAKNMKSYRGIMPQRVLADRMGISKNYRWISLFENAKREPTQSLILSFANTVNASVYSVIPEEVFNKLEPETTKLSPEPFDLDKANEEDQSTGDSFNIIINEGLLGLVSAKNPFEIELSIIISAGLNYFLNLSTHDALVYLLSNIKESNFEKALIKRIMEKERYKEGIEALRTLASRK
jgi:transcriptional regulator with XRE-family HTH domain